MKRSTQKVNKYCDEGVDEEVGPEDCAHVHANEEVHGDEDVPVVVVLHRSPQVQTHM